MAAVTKVTRYYHHYYHHNHRHYYSNNLKINSGIVAISTCMRSLTSRILDKRISSMWQIYLEGEVPLWGWNFCVMDRSLRAEGSAYGVIAVTAHCSVHVQSCLARDDNGTNSSLQMEPRLCPTQKYCKRTFYINRISRYGLGKLFSILS